MIIKTKDDLAKYFELISTSYHEAGHTVYGLLHFMYINYVCVFENKEIGRFEGLTHYNSPDIDYINDQELFKFLLKSEIGLKYAGLIAEKHYFKLMSNSANFPLFLRDGSSDDTLSASSLLRKYNVSDPGIKRKLYKKRFQTKVLTDLIFHWEDIKLIAFSLIKKKRINAKDLKNLLTKKSPNKNIWIDKFKKIEFINKNAHKMYEQDLKSLLF